MNELKDITTYVLEMVGQGAFDADTSIELLQRLNGAGAARTGDVAIIGMSCRFPGADDYDEYWQNLINQVGVIGSFPAERSADMGESVKLKAGWLQHIGDFDAAFFKISPKEAITMHPEQRIFLELAWACLEDAGYCGDRTRGSNTGVFVGVDHSYPMEYKPHGAEHNLLDMTGSMSSVLASRISYVLDLKGPNMVVDTACSSGLVAIHQACAALRNDECELALAGGLHLLSVTDASFDGVASEDGVLSAFDRYSTGTVWGEGFGFVTLKLADQAIADGDHIYAIIRGIAINNDGHTSGVTAPSPDTQAAVIEAAWRQAAIDPEELSYVEAHATGTVLGDPIEVNGLSTAFGKFTKRRQFCALGSVKPNLGHGVSAASMASLIKLLLAFREQQLPPNINFTEPNPYIAFHDSPLYVSDTTRAWEPNGSTRLAAVSSFGFGRTNVHAVLEEAPARVADERPRELPLVLPLSARTPRALDELIGRYLNWFTANPTADIADVCHTAAVGRLHFECRLAIIGRDRAEIVTALRAAAEHRWDTDGLFHGVHRPLDANIEKQDEQDLTVADQRRLARAVDALLAEPISSTTQLVEICGQYTVGAPVDWSIVFGDCRYGRLALPTYPFQRKHYWLPLVDQPVMVEQAPALHPLIDRLAVAGRDEDVYVTRFEIGKQWILTEHVINGHSVIPGTGLLEMIYTACAHSSGSPTIELTDVMLQVPAVVSPEQPIDVHVVVRKSQAGMAVEVMSQDQSGAWTVHATANGSVLDPLTRPAPIDHAAAVSATNRESLPFDISQEYGGFRFGPRWRNVTSIDYTDQQILTRLQIDGDYQADLAQFTLHPALFDNAINIASEFLIQNTTHTMFLPFSCKSLKIYGGLPASFNSQQLIRNPIKKQMGAAAIDITLYEPDGRVLCVLEKYSLKRVTQRLFAEQRHHQLGFVAAAPLPAADRLGTVLIFGNQTEQCQLLIAQLRERADRVVEVTNRLGGHLASDDLLLAAPTEAAMVLEQLAVVDHIVHAASFGMTEASSSTELQMQVDATLTSLVDLTQALGQRGSRIRLLVLASGVHAIESPAEAVNPIGAAAMALARVVGAESARLTVSALDADVTLDAGLLAAELAHGQADSLVAIRDGARFTPVLEEVEIESFEAEPVTLHPDGIYLVTGGLDGIAGIFIEALTRPECAPQFAVLSRTAETTADADNDDPKLAARVARLAELRASGAKVELVRCDIADPDAVAARTAELRARYGRIRGIIHGAGLPGGALLMNRSLADFEAVLRPKIAGSWALRHATAADELDFTVLNSSLISVFGPQGQGDYAAANGYLNGLALADRARGRKTTTIAWSVWQQTGMARSFDIDAARGVFQTLSDADGAESFRGILGRRIGTILVGALDGARVAAAGGQIGIPLATPLAGDRRRSSENPTAPREVRLLGQGTLTDTQIELAHIWADIQGLDEVDVRDPLSESGGDSIVLSQFVGAINERYGKLIDISDVYSQPTVRQLADYLDRLRTPEQVGQVTDELSIEDLMNMVELGELDVAAASRLLDERGAG